MMTTFATNAGDNGESGLDRIGRGLTPFVNTGSWAARPGRAQLGIGDDGLTAYRRAADRIRLAAADSDITDGTGDNTASWEAGYTGQYISSDAFAEQEKERKRKEQEAASVLVQPKSGSGQRRGWGTWLSAGGLVGYPESYADGGEVRAMVNGDITKEEAALVQGAIAALSQESNMTPEERQAVLVELENVFGEGAVEALMAEMQKASGQSDGRSDSIPAVIDGVQPAALSEGEFVVPADIVSYIGKGSTQSGARELQGMIDMMRSSRGAGTQQPQSVGPPAATLAGR